MIGYKALLFINLLIGLSQASILNTHPDHLSDATNLARLAFEKWLGDKGYSASEYGYHHVYGYATGELSPAFIVRFQIEKNSDENDLTNCFGYSDDVMTVNDLHCEPHRY